MNDIRFLDTQLFFFINHLPHTPWSDTLAEGLSGFGYTWIVWVIIGMGLVIRNERKSHWFWVPLGVAIGLCFFLSELLGKHIVGRVRPDMLPGTIVVGSVPLGFSFPSTHTTVAFACAYVFSRKEVHWGWIYLLAVLVGLSRIYLGHHYPVDVVAGAVLGTGIGWVSIGVCRIVQRQYAFLFHTKKRKNKV